MAVQFTTPQLGTVAPTDWPWGRKLSNHPTVGGTNVGGLTGVLFGMPFLAVGIWVFSLALHPNGWVHGSPWLVGAFGAVFAAVGGRFCVLGVINVVSRQKYRRAAAARPNEQWLYDHRWRREGIAYSAFDTMLGRLVVALACSLIFVPFMYVGLTQPEARGFLLVGVIIAVFVGGVVWRRFLSAVREYRLYGNSFLHFGSFPFFLGDTLRARLKAPPHLGDFTTLSLTLRCVRQHRVYSYGRNQSAVAVSYEIYSQTTTVPHDQLAMLQDGELPFELSVPADQPATCFSGTPPTYWEIQATGKAQGIDYDAYFHVPVYNKNGAVG